MTFFGGVYMIFSVIGGDERMIYLGDLLKSGGHTVRMCGFEKHKRHIPCVSVGDAIFGAHCVVLPVPTSKDGKSVFTPLGANEILLKDLVSAADRKTVFFSAGTRLGAAQEYNYLAREEFSLLNAVPTAEGAIAKAIESTNHTLWRSRCLVIGYGRIGKVLCERLRAFGANVTTTYRRAETKSLIEMSGYDGIDSCALCESLLKYDIIFNTVPAAMLSEHELLKVKKDCIIIELASAPYGVDAACAEKCGIRVITASGLPAKTAPVTAAEIIHRTINNILNEHF